MNTEQLSKQIEDLQKENQKLREDLQYEVDRHDYILEVICSHLEITVKRECKKLI